ncbi:DUF1641 domain-containing protein [Aneurinibacillus terranovensis]|uniref:DUF1641 domain-containing protein n=1 Tax=Aneurinibacillus terranovensis TaxID=278991 RepID=UPI00040982F6|nr:DUF1641 domain-containing protein [Aneurinibacillus terranovensis]
MEIETKQQIPEQNLTWLNELSDPQVQEALTALIQKLPQIQEAMGKVEQGVEIVSSFARDTESINYLAERFERFSELALNKKNLESLAVIIENLPRIADMMLLLNRIASVVEPIITDKNSLAVVTDTAKLVTEPVTERVQEGISIVKEAKARAERNQTNVSIFGMLKLLKDPAVQKGFKFVQALLDVLSEKKILE